MAMRVYALCFSIFFATIAHAETAESLGKELFFDKRLSSDQTLSCASCHIPEKAFTNGKRVAEGVHGQRGDRNVPTLINRGGTHNQFWDMRAGSLQSQATMVIGDPSEMGGDIQLALRRLTADPNVLKKFMKVFGAPPSQDSLTRALVAFESTLVSGEAPYDRYMRGERAALTAEQIRGKDLFFNKFKCVHCHAGENFTDEKLNVRCYPFTTNIVAAPTLRFKTPTLRNLIYTAPYMHNGALPTLEDAVEFYNPSLQLNADGKPDPASPAVHINARQKKELVAFLKSLSAALPFQEKN